MAKPMTKAELIEDIADRAEMSKADAAVALHAVVASVSALTGIKDAVKGDVK